MRVFLSAVLLCVIGALVVNRVLAPLYGRYDASDCRTAYARARTHQDLIRVDLHPAVALTGGREKGTCGAFRAGHTESVAALSALVALRAQP